MTITHHASGSSGNAIQIDNTLIDCGIVLPYADMDYHLLITHAHIDHIKHIEEALTHCTSFYAPTHVIESVEDRVSRWKQGANIVNLMVEKYRENGAKWFNVKHDIPCVGYDLGDYVHVTDTAWVDNVPVGRRFYTIESNYDRHELMLTNRTDYIKQRIIATHLSNEEAIRLAMKVGAKEVMFVHLSQEANSAKLAQATHAMFASITAHYPKEGDVIEV